MVGGICECTVVVGRQIMDNYNLSFVDVLYENELEEFNRFK